jgi:hypothetical protein
MQWMLGSGAVEQRCVRCVVLTREHTQLAIYTRCYHMGARCWLPVLPPAAPLSSMAAAWQKDYQRCQYA